MRSWKCRITDASTVVVACFFLRQPLEIDSGASKAGTRQRVIRRPCPLARVVFVALVDHEDFGSATLSHPTPGPCARNRRESGHFGLFPPQFKPVLDRDKGQATRRKPGWGEIAPARPAMTLRSLEPSPNQLPDVVEVEIEGSDQGAAAAQHNL